MYVKFKRLVRKLIPKRILFKYEPLLRFVLYQFYKGERFQCNLCFKTIRRFIESEEGDKLCPFCGSLSRTRRLWDIVNSGYLINGAILLDFSPSRSFYRVLKTRTDIDYISSDLSEDFLSDFQYDITNISSRDEVYDLIICYHILEHIEDDSRAMKELFRVLKKGGTCIIQTPFKEGDIYEDPAVVTEIGRLKHFGQSDHVRIYSINGLKDRLVNCGFLVTIKNYIEPQDNRLGLKTNEEVIICTK